MQRVVKYLLLLLAAIVVLCLAVGAWLIHDGDWIREQTEVYVSGITGRQFSIDGPFNIDLSLDLVLSAEDLRLANTSWASATDLVRLRKLRFSMNVLSLFSDRVAFNFIELDGLTLALAENDQGEVNWDLFPTTDRETEDQKREDGEPVDDLPVSADRLVLKDIHVSHQAPGRDKPLDFVLLEFEAEKNDDEMVTATAHGSLGNLPLEFHGRAGPLKHLIIGGVMELKIDLSLGEINFNLQGEVADSLTGQGTDVTLNFSGPDIAWVTQQFALPDFTHGPFDFDLKVDTGDYDTKLILVGDLGHLDVNASGNVDDFRHPREGEVKFEITGPDLQSLGEALGEPNLAAVPYHIMGDVSAHLGVVEIHTFQFEVGKNTGQVVGKMGEWPELSNTDLHVFFSGPDLSQWGPVLHLEGLTAQAFNYTGNLAYQDSGLLWTSNRLEAGDSHIELSGSLGRPPEFPGTSIDLDLYFPDLSRVTVLAEHGLLPREPLTVKGSVTIKEQMLWLDNMQANLGENRASFSGQIALTDGLAGSKFSGRAEIPSVASVGRYFSLEHLPELPASIGAALNFSATGLSFKLADSRLGEMAVDLEGTLPDLQTPDQLSASVRLEIPSLRKIPFYPQAKNLPDLPGRINGQVQYLDGVLRLANVTGSIANSKFDFDAVLTFAEKFAGSFIDFEISGPSFRTLVPVDSMNSLPGQFKASGRFEKAVEADRIDNIELELGNIRARVNGTVDDLTDLTSANLSVQLSLPSLSVLDGFVDRTYPDFPFNFAASFSGNGRQFTLDHIQANLGPSDLSGKISMDFREHSVIAGRLHADYLDIAVFSVPDENQEASASSAQATVGNGGQIFPDVPIPYTQFGDVKMDLDLSADRLNLEFTELNDVWLDLSLSEDFLRLNTFEFEGPLDESVSGSLAIGGNEKETQLQFTMDGANLRLGLMTTKDQDIRASPPLDISIELAGAGATWHELASSLDGSILLVQGEGMLANAGMNLLFSDLLTELFNTLNPFARQSKHTQLECSVTHARIESGTVLVDPFIFHTEQITILSKGEINLETERINLEFQTKVRKGIGISAGTVVNPFIKLGGTLSSPSIELDPAGVAFSGSVAVATAGLSLLGKSLFDRYLSNKDPCGNALSKLNNRDTMGQ